MTAIVGILNRRGLAFAADSAATHRTKSGYKISNNANKIFTLSKYHPVGIALYNNLDFMNVPWDSIIKQFRDNQGGKKYDTLREYVKPFFNFVKSYCVNTLQDQQLFYTSHIINSYCKAVFDVVEKEVGRLSETNADDFFQKAMLQMDVFYNEFNKNRAEDFKGYKQKDFEKYAELYIDKVLSFYTANPRCPIELKNKFCDSLFAVVCHNSNIYLDRLFSGLVFFGYGEKDIFPSLLEYSVTYALDGRIKYSLLHIHKIGPEPGAALIAPFAQTDVANTVVRAVEDNLRKAFYDNYKSTLNGFKEEIINLLVNAQAPSVFVNIFNNLDIDKYTDEYKKGMDAYIDNKYIRPLLDTVAFLDKEDLADMAESLVRMTCLKRHVTTDEETVGGPVDVAIVTKGDGFIWKKRKHYFDPEMNSQFFERYKK